MQLVEWVGNKLDSLNGKAIAFGHLLRTSAVDSDNKSLSSTNTLILLTVKLILVK